MDIPKIAIIGCGTVAQRYYVPVLKELPEIKEKVLLVDRDRRNAEMLQDILGSGEIYLDHRSVLGKADGVLILLPHDLHHQVSMDFLRSGTHVLCEKPLAIQPHEAREMIDTAEEAHAALCLNNTRRLFPSFRAVHEMITAGELGRILKISYQEGSAFGWPSSTGFYVNPALSSMGILLDLGSHVMDILCWWAGGKPELKEFLDDSQGGPESVIRVMAQKEGCELRVVMNRLCELPSSFEITGERGQVKGKIHDWKHITAIDDKGDTRVIKLYSRAKSYPAFVKPVLNNFIRVVQGLEQPLVSGRDVMASIEFINECYLNRKHFVCAWDKGVETSASFSGISMAQEKRRILVTGATGFIGGRVIEILHQSDSKGSTAVAGLRQWASAARLGRMPVAVAIMDLMDKGQITQALKGVTHVIHCAKGTPEATVEGTRNLLDACLALGTKHFIHLSTAEVYGDATGIVDERRPFQYTGNLYNRMKIDAEKACWEFRDKGLPLTVFRPSIVYGPFSSSWSLRFAQMMLAGEWGILEGYGGGTCNLVYVDDLVHTILQSLDNDNAFGKVFNMNGPEVVSWNKYFTILNRSLALPPLNLVRKRKAEATTYVMGPVRTLGSLVKRYFMKPVKKAAESFEFIDAVLRKAEHAVKVSPSMDELRLFSRDVIYSDALARSSLPYCPDTEIEKGMGHTIEWLKYLGIVSNDEGQGVETYQISNSTRA
jgi:predicted dehydrogenase/nucleoside-diphosphate-sugar epimerase